MTTRNAMDLADKLLALENSSLDEAALRKFLR